MTVSESFNSPFPGKDPSFCSSCEPLETTAHHGKRAYEPQFLKTSSSLSILEFLRPANSPLAQTDGKCFCFICNLIQAPVQEKGRGKNS